jgi:hypothetical protein
VGGINMNIDSKAKAADKLSVVGLRSAFFIPWVESHVIWFRAGRTAYRSIILASQGPSITLIKLVDDYTFDHYWYDAYKCPSCGERVIQEWHNFCSVCGSKVQVIKTAESLDLEKKRDFVEDEKGFIREVK